MADFVLLATVTLFALAAGALTRYGWMEKDQGYLFLGVVLLVGSVIAIVRVMAAIVGKRRAAGR